MSRILSGGGGGVHDWDGAWPGACMARGVCVAGGYAWQGGVHAQGVCMARGGAFVAGGACMARVCAWLGDVHGWGVCMARGACAACTPPTPRPDTTRYGQSMSGRYASYWNAFLFWSENKAMMFPDGFLENPI